MSYCVICISRTLGAGGEIVGRAVAERLGFRYVDEEIVTRAAERAAVDPTLVAEVERRQPFIKRLLDSIASPVAVAGVLDYASGVPTELYYYDRRSAAAGPVADDYRAIIREVIRETAHQGDVVIVAHAASMALGGRDGVLRVLVTASPETRAQRLSALGQQLAGRDAAATVKDSDRDRRDYFRRFYSINEELPTHYDLVINTDLLDPDQAVDLIVTAARP